MRDALDNPFSPGSDVVPEVWAGRIAQLSDWRDVLRPRLIAGLHERGRTLLGEPGTGKSSLVRRIAKEAESAGDWATPQLRIPSGADPLKIVASAVLDLAATAGLGSRRDRRLAAMLRGVEAVAVAGVSLAVRDNAGPEPYAALRELLIEVGAAAVARGNVVLIHIDEVQNITDERALSQLLIAVGDAITHTVSITVPGGARVDRYLPLAVYLTGLPDFEDMAGARKGATFARRFGTTTLSAIDDDDLRAALRPFVTEGWAVADGTGGAGRVRMTPDAAAGIVECCCGEPFLLQLAGERAWYAGTDPVITRRQVLSGWASARAEAAAHVERILGRLPERELEFVRSMAELPPGDRSLSRIAQGMGFARAEQAGPTSQRLDTVRGIVDRGRLYTFRHRAVEAYLTSGWPRITN